ncbi:hypothetical protein KM043_001111 [Ampulex compressa]|nr:hypothetical protein KM043_001111 [Ampulex compressa]
MINPLEKVLVFFDLAFDEELQGFRIASRQHRSSLSSDSSHQTLSHVNLRHPVPTCFFKSFRLFSRSSSRALSIYDTNKSQNSFETPQFQYFTQSFTSDLLTRVLETPSPREPTLLLVPTSFSKFFHLSSRSSSRTLSIYDTNRSQASFKTPQLVSHSILHIRPPHICTSDTQSQGSLHTSSPLGPDFFPKVLPPIPKILKSRAPSSTLQTSLRSSTRSPIVSRFNFMAHFFEFHEILIHSNFQGHFAYSFSQSFLRHFPSGALEQQGLRGQTWRQADIRVEASQWRRPAADPEAAPEEPRSFLAIDIEKGAGHLYFPRDPCPLTGSVALSS